MVMFATDELEHFADGVLGNRISDTFISNATGEGIENAASSASQEVTPASTLRSSQRRLM